MKLLTPWDRFLHIGWFPLPKVKEISIPGMPAYLRGMKALFVSDVHLRKSVPDVKLHALMELISAQQADIVLLGGDYAEGADQCVRFFEALHQIHAPLGCFGVRGNNDEAKILVHCMEAAGIHFLSNSEHAIDLPGGRLSIGGCDDHLFGEPETSHLFSGDAHGFRILLSHFPILPDCRCDLMLSGHTHGGQMNFLGVTPYSVGFEHRHHLAAVRGMHSFGNMRLAVCNGIGVSRIPLRMGAEPQILLLKFDG